ncbi:MAG: hypothetical protein C4321_10185, partial [Chloroflexota bacterium]
MAVDQEAVAEVGAEEPGGAGDEHALVRDGLPHPGDVHGDLLAAEEVLDPQIPDVPEAHRARDQLRDVGKDPQGDPGLLGSRGGPSHERLAGRGDGEDGLVHVEVGRDPRELRDRP